MPAFLLAALLLAACTPAEHTAAVANRAPASAPETAAIAPAGCPEVPDGALRVFRRVDRCVALVNESRGPLDKWPAVWTRVDGRWSHHRLDQLAGQHWSGAVEIAGDIVGVTDSAVEAPGWELTVVASRDGERWDLRGRLRKVYYFATVSAVAVIDDDLAIAIELDDGYGAGVKPGVYRYRSADAGRSWERAR